MTKVETLRELFVGSLVFLSIIGILLLVGLDVYFLAETLINIRSPLEVFIGSAFVSSFLSTVLLLIIFVLDEVD